jgi:hypothetical protein
MSVMIEKFVLAGGDAVGVGVGGLLRKRTVSFQRIASTQLQR